MYSLRFVTVQMLQMHSGLNTPGTSRYYQALGRKLCVHEFQPGGKLIKGTRNTSCPVDEAPSLFRTIVVELREYTHEPVNNDERFIVYSAQHRGHANAQSVLTPVPVSRQLALNFSSSLFSSTAADDSRARSRAGSSLMLIGPNPDVEFNSAHASDAQARGPNGVQT